MFWYSEMEEGRPLAPLRNVSKTESETDEQRAQKKTSACLLAMMLANGGAPIKCVAHIIFVRVVPYCLPFEQFNMLPRYHFGKW